MADREVAFMDYDQEISESSLYVEQSLPTPESAKASAALSNTTTTDPELFVDDVSRDTSFGIDQSLPIPDELRGRDINLRRRTKCRWISAALLPFVVLVAAGTLAFFIYAGGVDNGNRQDPVAPTQEEVETFEGFEDGNTGDDDVVYGIQAEEDFKNPVDTEDEAETAAVEPPVEFVPPTMPPTTPPTVEATEVNAPVESVESRLARITAILSPVTNLTDQSSPQYQSISTLAKAPEEMLLIPTNVSDYPKFIQHYVIVLLYYTLGGSTWDFTANFFITGEECNWNIQSVFYVGGVFCKNGAVTSLYLPSNNVKGKIPTEIGLLSSMKLLRLNSNDLSGEIPSELSKLTNLVDLQLNHNALTGSIPTLFNEFWTSLEILNFANNLLTGTIPSDITALHKSLVILALDDNFFEGTIADNMGALTELVYLYLEQNGFNDTLADDSLVRLENLQQLDLSDNYFHGDFPPHLLQHDNLTVIDLHDNQITNFPTSLPNNTVLGFLALHNNQFTQPLPSSLTNLRNLEHLDLSNNEFTGDISPFLGGMTTLTYLFLANNPFTPGIIPDSFMPGLLPEFAGLTRLTELSLKNTSRVGTIPPTLSKLTELVLLDLDRNSLEGTIPSTLSEIEPLNFLLLNRNNLTGTLPLAFTNSSVIMLLLDRNQLEGDVTFLCDGTANSKRRDVVVLDCGGNVPEIQCAGQCCTCCDSAISLDGLGLEMNGTDVTVTDMCDDTSMLANLDPTWEHGFGRLQYDFDVAAWKMQGFY
mmetsp:Transcript_45087/g.54182  ORF Transcript_45087/g.54182 Transcript_45087/m.54182 type:complete len:759 (+) Transcript_45087:97-2373(+)